MVKYFGSGLLVGKVWFCLLFVLKSMHNYVSYNNCLNARNLNFTWKGNHSLFDLFYRKIGFLFSKDLVIKYVAIYKSVINHRVYYNCRFDYM